MAETGGSSGAKWFWAIVVILLFALVVIWFLDPFGDVPEAAPAATQTPSTEWTTAPDEAGVPIELPETPMTNAPADEASPSAAPTE